MFRVFWMGLDSFGQLWIVLDGLGFIIWYTNLYLLNGKQTNPTRDIDRPKLKNMSGHTGVGQRSKCVRPRIG